jgi:ribosomal protein S18 acetylase RimI-like enzyme
LNVEGIAVRPAMPEDALGIAGVFGRAFDDYRRGLGLDAEAVGRLWQGSLAARVESTRVAVTPAGTVVGFVVFVRPGEKERYGSRREGRRQAGRWRRELGFGSFWRAPLLFIPMGLAYARRHARKDEMYLSLLGVDPGVQGRGIGQALLAAAEEEARACGAAAILLHTSSANTRAQASYHRAGYELVCTVRAPWPGPAGIPAYLALRKPLSPEPTPRLDELGY